MKAQNFLAQVLSSAEEFQLDKLNTKVPEINLAVENCKSNLLPFIENVYVNFTERPKSNKVLVTEANRLLDVASLLQKSLRDVSKTDLLKTSKDVENYSLALQKVNIGLNFVLNICNINEGLNEIGKLQKQNCYNLAMQKCKVVRNLIEAIPEDEKLPVVDELKISLITEKNFLLDKLTNILEEHIIFFADDDTKTNSLRIRKCTADITQILQALYDYKSNVEVLDELTKFLWNYVFIPVVDKDTNVHIKKEGEVGILEIGIIESNTKVDYNDVFGRLILCLNFLSDNLNYALDENMTALKYIGRDLRDNLAELIIKHCLQNTIPTTKEGLEKYNVVMENIKVLELALVKCEIFDSDSRPLVTYASDIDILFINRKCREYQEVASELMKKDLDNMEEVGTSYNPNNPLLAINQFSKCSISKNVPELLKLMEKILQEALQSSELCAGRFLCTVRNFIQTYITFVPEYHKKILQTIPRQVALFHNNCLFLSHILTCFNEMYGSEFVQKLHIETPLFGDDSHRLEIIAGETFSEYVEGQVKQIEDIMKESGLFNVQLLDKLDARTEKCVRQCLRQQELLKTVWGKVLPYEIYNQTLGLIFDSLCKLLISAITALEDISSVVSEQLVDILKLIITRGPRLFSDPKEINLYSSSWYKLNELMFVLNSSLLDINDRWADGKGPLAIEFKPEELRRLIKALFQNTDKRASLLAKII